MQMKPLGAVLGAASSVIIYGYYQQNIAKTQKAKEEVWVFDSAHIQFKFWSLKPIP